MRINLHRARQRMSCIAFIAACLVSGCANAQMPGNVRTESIQMFAGNSPAWVFPAFVGPPSLVARSFGEVVSGKPYSAELEFEHVQNLADGNQIVRSGRARIYRDSEGRTRREHTSGWSTVAQPPGNESQIAMVDDPVSGLSFQLDFETRTARVLPSFDFMIASRADGDGDQPAPSKGVSTFGSLSRVYRSAAGGDNVTRTLQISPQPNDQSWQTEHLGQQTLSGVVVVGTRRTQTIPARQIGNILPIEIVSEQWHSPDLEIDVLRTTRDPLAGETRIELLNISQSEPAAELFTVPENFEAIGPGMNREPSTQGR